MVRHLAEMAVLPNWLNTVRMRTMGYGLMTFIGNGSIAKSDKSREYENHSEQWIATFSKGAGIGKSAKSPENEL